MPTLICSNCSNHYRGHFCNNCGQKAVHRITMPHLWHELWHAITHTDKGLLYLIKALFVNPGKVAREYIVAGKRKRYFSPFQYLIIIGTITTFIMANSHYLEKNMEALSSGTQAVSATQAALQQKINYYQQKYFTLIILFQLPFLSLATFWLYKKQGYNYAEHLTLHSFISGQTTLIAAILAAIVFFLKDTGAIRLVLSLMVLSTLIYHLVMYVQFFGSANVKGVLKALATYLLGFIFFMSTSFLLALIITIAYMMYFKA